MHSVLHAHCLVLEPVALLPFSLSGQLSVLGFAFHSQARQCIRPNRIHHCFSYGLVIRLRLLSTPSLDDAVTFDYGQPVLLSDGDFHPTVGAPSQAHECVRLVARFQSAWSADWTEKRTMEWRQPGRKGQFVDEQRSAPFQSGDRSHAVHPFTARAPGLPRISSLLSDTDVYREIIALL